MTQITSYTDTDAIRGSLGVDTSDCTDEMIVGSNLELELTVDLDGWLSTHETIFTAGNETAATITEKLLRNYLVLYAQWFCAYELSSRFLTFPQISSDGKAQMNRFANFDLTDMQGQAAARMAKYKKLLDSAVNGTPSTLPPIMGKSIPDYDPVTG